LLYQGHRKHAIDAVRLNGEHRVDDALIQTIDRVIFLTGVIQTLAKRNRFTAIAHSLHNGLTLMKDSHRVLHGLKVGYGIIVQLYVEKRPKQEFEDVLSFFRQLGLEPSLKGLNLSFDRDVVLRVAEMAAANPEMGALNYPVNKLVIARAMEALEKRFA
jgi:glycerol dehydrogenase